MFDAQLITQLCFGHSLSSRAPFQVILSGMDVDELERVQRLCILAWMKAVDWEILKVLALSIGVQNTPASLFAS